MKPVDRALDDFYIGGALPTPEKSLLSAARLGAPCNLGPSAGYPERTDANAIRARFIRFLLLGGDDDAPVHETGLDLSGAFIEGLIDLDDCEAKCSFKFEQCTLEQGLCLSDTTMKGFVLFGCLIGKPSPTTFVTDGADIAIFAERAKISGSVFIARNCETQGQIRFGSASIAGDLNLRASHFAESKGVSINLSASRIGGNLHLGEQPPEQPIDSPDTIFKGRVLLSKATIAGDVFCGKTIIRAPGTSKKAALYAPGANIQGAFDFRTVRDVESVLLLGAKIGTLLDDLRSWELGSGKHRLNGLVYDRIADESRSIDRRVWLEMQRPEDLRRVKAVDASGLRRQPWEQAARTFEAGGDAKGAKKLRIALERRASKARPWWRRVLDFGYDVLCRFGYAPSRLAVIAIAVWIVGTVAADRIAKAGQFAATDNSVRISPLYKACDPPTGSMQGNFWSGYCTRLTDSDAVGLYPWLYSADNLIPVIDLGQRKAWTLRSQVDPSLFWLLKAQYVFGFVVGTALLATLGSLIVRKSS